MYYAVYCVCMYVCNNAGNLRSEGKGDTTEDKDKEKYIHVHNFKTPLELKARENMGVTVCTKSMVVYTCTCI